MKSFISHWSIVANHSIFAPMCGIHALLGIVPDHQGGVAKAFSRSVFGVLNHRGPDSSILEDLGACIFGFHRRMIQGLGRESDEPLHAYDNLTLVCNGEIYNHHELKAAHPDWPITTQNDCEVILHLYKTYGIKEAVKKLDGEFAFILYNEETGEIFMARDHMGVRPLYTGSLTLEGDDTPLGTVVASELEGLTCMPSPYRVMGARQVEPRKVYFMYDDLPDAVKSTYYHFPSPVVGKMCDSAILRDLFIDAVRKRVDPKNRDVPLCFTLSGGWDSSIVTSVGVYLLKTEFGVDPSTIPTYCIGKPGSPDLAAAKEVADFLGTRHTTILVDDEEMIGMVEIAIRRGGTFCRTSIRAMVPHLLVAKRIAEDGKAIVVLSGEAADEIWGSYAYCARAPSPEAHGEEILKLCSEIHLSDGLRADRSIAAYGLELRVPFTDKAFLGYVLSLDPSVKVFGKERLEKAAMREAFSATSGREWLPTSVLERRKDGFSDSVSGKEGPSWVDGLLAFIETKVADEDVPEGMTKETYYYRQRFNEIFGKGAITACCRPSGNLGKEVSPCESASLYKSSSVPPKPYESSGVPPIPYEWMPNPVWCPDATDPSGRQGLGDDALV